MKRSSLLLIGLLLLIPCKSQTLSQIDWKSDLDFLARELPQKHVGLFTIRTQKEFEEGLEQIKLNSDTTSDLGVAIKLQQLIAGFGDSHSFVNYNQFIDPNQLLPFQLYEFSDGLYILKTTSEYKELLGRQLISINGIPVQKIADSLSTLITRDNASIIKNRLPNLFSSKPLLEHFGFVKQTDISLTSKDSTGQMKTILMKPEVMDKFNNVVFQQVSIPICNKNQNAFFNEYYQPVEKIYYLQYNKCWSKELELDLGNAQKAENMPSFKTYEKKVFETLMKETVEKIVFDMRYNSGGNSLQGKQFIEKLAQYLEVNPKIKVYVIIGRKTFSSAILNAMDFKRLTKAVFVGEETSGKPNHFGEVKNFQLPSSQLQINYSTKYFKRTDESLHAIIPDVNIETSFSDYARGIDPVYEWIKTQP